MMRPTHLKRADQFARGHATPDPVKALSTQLS